MSENKLTKGDLTRCIPYWSVYIGGISVFFVDFSPYALIFCLATYFIRMFSITGFYHRYFSHKTFKTSRFVQFLFAVIGTTSGQRGPIWWAAHHRSHHRHSDTPKDVHSLKQHGFLWSHMLWFVSGKNFQTRSENIKDFIKFTELRIVDKLDIVIPVLFFVLIYYTGLFLEVTFPSLKTTADQYFIYGGIISTILLHQATFTVNSLAHKFGTRRFDTNDDSRNNFWIALYTLGEGWHNNHHFYPGTVRQGFKPWELDITYYLLKLMEAFGLIWDLKELPENIKKMPSPSNPMGAV